jgi:hypothetical protein
MYDVSVDERGRILQIRLANAVPFEEHLAARERVLELCRQHSLRRILVDARELKGPVLPTTLDLFEFGSTWPVLGRKYSVRLAGVLPEDPQVRQWLSFGEQVGANRGFHTASFENVEQARAWLLSVQD